MFSRLLNHLNALFNLTLSLEELGEGAETGARRPLPKAPTAILVGAAFAGALLLMLGLPVQAQEGSARETKDNYAFLDGDPEERNKATAELSKSDLDEDSEGNTYVAGELLVAYKQATPQVTKNEVDQQIGAKVLDKFPQLDSRLVSFPEIKNEPSKEAREQALEEKKQELEQDPNVEAVGYNYLRWAAGSTNDPYSGAQ